MILTLARGTFTEFGSPECWKSVGFISISAVPGDPDDLRHPPFSWRSGVSVALSNLTHQEDIENRRFFLEP